MGIHSSKAAIAGGTACVSWIQALGGGWTTSQLPTT